jgi:hypothetical protein
MTKRNPGELSASDPLPLASPIMVNRRYLCWSGWRDSDPRPIRSEAIDNSALISGLRLC